MTASPPKHDQDAAADSDHPRDAGAAVAGEPPFNRTKLGVITIVTGLTVLVVFLGNMVYLFGSTFQQTERNHRFTIAAVNYDSSDSLVWNSLVRAYDVLRADSFASVVFLDNSTYPDAEELVGAVREQEFWGAVYVSPGASSRLAAAVAGQSDSYDASHAVTYVWNEIRYPAVAASVIRSGILQLQGAAVKVFQAGATQQLLRGASSSRARTAVAAYVTPFNATEINVAPAPQASKAFYNTVIMAIGIVQQNVFLIAFTGISKASGLFTRPFKTSGTWALLVGVVYTFFGSLVTAGYVWAYREDWPVTGSQFALTWMVLWLGQHTYYQLLDGTLGLLPIQVFSFILVTFLFINITSTIFPLESSPGFYRWGHALPAYQVLQVLLNIWSHGSHRLYEALPVLFSWWLISATYAAIGTLKKSRDGRKNGVAAVKEAPAVVPVVA